MPFRFFSILFFLFSTQLNAQEVVLWPLSSSQIHQYSDEATLFEAAIQQHPWMHASVKKEEQPEKLRNAENPTARFMLGMFCLFVFAGIRNYFSRYFHNLFQVFTSLTITKRQVREQLENDVIASAWFYLLFFLGAGMLLYFSLLHFNLFPHGKNPWWVYWMGVLALFVYYLFKRYLLQLVSWSFQKKDVAGQFNFNSAIVNEFLGVILFPVGLLLLFVHGILFQVIFWLALIMFSILVVYRYFRVFKHIKNILRIDLFHFLIYLCAFEIMPVLILIKLSA